MNIAELVDKLRQAVEDGTPTHELKILMNAPSDDHDVYELMNLSIETDMRTGDTVIMLVGGEEPVTTNAQDFEPHPAHESGVNAWMFE